VSFPGEGESPPFPLVRLAGASLCLLFSNFRFGMAETGSIFYGDRFSRSRRDIARIPPGGLQFFAMMRDAFPLLDTNASHAKPKAFSTFPAI
jgi:hypothetical protein